MNATDRGSQRMDALKLANQVRKAKSQIKIDLKAGEVTIGELLDETPGSLQNTELQELLLAIPKFGRGKVNRVLTLSRISPAKKVGSLSERQRGELMWAIRKNQPRSSK